IEKDFGQAPILEPADACGIANAGVLQSRAAHDRGGSGAGGALEILQIGGGRLRRPFGDLVVPGNLAASMQQDTVRPSRAIPRVERIGRGIHSAAKVAASRCRKILPTSLL